MSGSQIPPHLEGVIWDFKIWGGLFWDSAENFFAIAPSDFYFFISGPPAGLWVRENSRSISKVVETPEIANKLARNTNSARLRIEIEQNSLPNQFTTHVWEHGRFVHSPLMSWVSPSPAIHYSTCWVFSLITRDFAPIFSFLSKFRNEVCSDWSFRWM